MPGAGGARRLTRSGILDLPDNLAAELALDEFHAAQSGIRVSVAVRVRLVVRRPFIQPNGPGHLTAASAPPRTGPAGRAGAARIVGRRAVC